MHASCHMVGCMVVCSLFLAQQEFLKLLSVVSVWKGQNSIRCCHYKSSSLQAQRPFWFLFFFLCFIFSIMSTPMRLCIPAQLEEGREWSWVPVPTLSTEWSLHTHWRAHTKFEYTQTSKPFSLLCTIKYKWQFRKCVITSSSRGKVTPEVLLLLVSSGRNEFNWTGTII